MLLILLNISLEHNLKLTPTMSISAAESVANNDHLLTEILLRLPVKPLARFKSVSNHWLSLISTTPQLSSPKPTNSLLLQQNDHLHNLDLLPIDEDDTAASSFPFCSLAFFPDRSSLTIASSNGLLLCYQNNDPNVTYFVYNPTTNRHTTLPPLPKASNPWNFTSYFSFDPSNSTSPHYKVASLRIFHTPPTCQVLIYSSQTRHWKLLESSSKLNPKDYFNLRNGASWNGAIHWMSHKGSFRLDLNQEKILESPTIPITHFSKSYFDYFGVSWNRLHVINSSDKDHRVLNIYEMGSDFSCWSLKYKVEIGDEVTSSFPDMVRSNGRHYWYTVPYFSQGSISVDEPYLVLQIKTELVCYYFGSGMVRKIHEVPVNYCNRVSIHGGGRRELPLCGAYQYIETPFCV